jgi:hypothetical protein
LKIFLFIVQWLLFSVLNTGVLTILPVVKDQVLEDLVTLMRQLAGHALLIKQERESSTKFQHLAFVYVVAEVPDGYLVLILQHFTQQQLELCATLVRVVHHVHALPLSRCVSLIVVLILYLTCRRHLNVRCEPVALTCLYRPERNILLKFFSHPLI